MNLDKLLKKVEKNSLNADVQKTFPLTVGGEEFEVLTMTRKEKQDFIYSRSTTKTNMTIGDAVKWAKPYIYRSLQLAQLAEKAIDAGYIKRNYDIVEMLFEPEELAEIIAFIVEINNLGEAQKEAYEDIKKQ